jgi:hypothetical protein
MPGGHSRRTFRRLDVMESALLSREARCRDYAPTSEPSLVPMPMPRMYAPVDPSAEYMTAPNRWASRG